MECFSASFEKNFRCLNTQLCVEQSFDMLSRDFEIGGRRASLFFVDDFVKDEALEKILMFLLQITPEQLEDLRDDAAFLAKCVPYAEVGTESRVEPVVTRVLSGTMAMLLDGFSTAFLIDARVYPMRSIAEPQNDRVLRGAHDGFVEALKQNAGLLRRRIRDPRLHLEKITVGTKSHTDLVMCYLAGVADEKQVSALRKKLKSITIPALVMGQESLYECLSRRQFYNPFPKVRYTERPDRAAAGIMEGKILVMVDNTPTMMILPTGIFDFLQDTNDYYLPPIVSTYLRWIRGTVFFMTLFVTPIWFLLLQNPTLIPPWLSFIAISEDNGVALIFQLLIAEVMIDVIKLASLNTPNVLNNAFGIVGALILGDFAVNAGWFVPEVLLYMAFVAISTFTQTSYELGYAFKMLRMALLILSAVFSFWGFLGGIVLVVVLAATTDTPLGRCYLYPLIPFDKTALSRLFLRRRLTRFNS